MIQLLQQIITKMYQEIINKTRQLLEDFNNSIAFSMDQKGITNTGEAKQSLRIEIDPAQNIARSIGVDYIEILNTGRGPGRFPPPGNIAEWVRSKLGIDDMSTKSIAYLIGRKIAREGTEIFKDKSKGLQIEDKIINLRQQLKTEIPKHTKTIVLNTLRQFTKQHLKN